MVPGLVSVHISLEDVGDYLTLVAAVLGAGAALLVLRDAGRGWWRRTIGRRRDHYRRLRRLGTNAQLSYTSAVLGQPPAVKRSLLAQVPDYSVEYPEDAPEDWQYPLADKPLIEWFYLDRDYYVQALTDEDDTVLAFSVTTRSKRFRPRFRAINPPGRLRRISEVVRGRGRYWETFNVKLGKTKFSQAMRHENERVPDKILVEHGARTYSYSERYYFGNPGFYQHSVLTSSSAAWHFSLGDVRAINPKLQDEWAEVAGPESTRTPSDALKAYFEFRSKTTITTITVIGDFPVDHFPTTYGPHEDRVRTLP